MGIWSHISNWIQAGDWRQCADSRHWCDSQRRTAIRPYCRNVPGAAIGPLPSAITVTNGPELKAVRQRQKLDLLSKNSLGFTHVANPFDMAQTPYLALNVAFYTLHKKPTSNMGNLQEVS